MQITAIDVFSHLVGLGRNSAHQDMTATSASNNRIQAVGLGLEEFVKRQIVETARSQGLPDSPLSWLGNANNPPDLMIKGGEAWEVKKTGVPGSSIQLNSSLPKRTIRAESTFVTGPCRTAEIWTEKIMVYVVGRVVSNSLHSLFFCYGDVLCASNEIYERTNLSVKTGLRESGLPLSDTKELGRLNNADPLSRAQLRIRGMWTLQSPFSAFANLTGHVQAGDAILIVSKSEFELWQKAGRSLARGIQIQHLEAPDPDNGAKTIQVVLLKGNL